MKIKCTILDLGRIKNYHTKNSTTDQVKIIIKTIQVPVQIIKRAKAKENPSIDPKRELILKIRIIGVINNVGKKTVMREIRKEVIRLDSTKIHQKAIKLIDQTPKISGKEEVVVGVQKDDSKEVEILMITNTKVNLKVNIEWNWKEKEGNVYEMKIAEMQ